MLTDCPSRERSGWLCDSYFTAQAEHALTGKSCVERNLLRAYLLAPEPVSCQPFGMLPQCYPSDHFDGSYIANWALWLVLELKGYLARSGDEELVRLFRGKVMRLFDFLRRFENEDGLLEDVGGWVFVEWSRANDFTEGVNYPSNMLYSAALQAAGELYGEKKLLEKGEKVAERVREQSFNGTFFADNAVRKEGVLARTENTSETCQYYAFGCSKGAAPFFGRNIPRFGLPMPLSGTSCVSPSWRAKGEESSSFARSKSAISIWLSARARCGRITNRLPPAATGSLP